MKESSFKPQLIVEGTLSEDYLKRAEERIGEKVLSKFGSSGSALSVLTSSKLVQLLVALVVASVVGFIAIYIVTSLGGTDTENNNSQQVEEGSEITNDPSSSDSAYIRIKSLVAGPNWVGVDWDVVGLRAEDGFGVVWNTSGNPIDSADGFKRVKGSEDRSTYLTLADGEIYYISVCIFRDDSCDVYSTVESIQTNVGERIDELIIASPGQNRVGWITEGGTGYGIMVAWDRNNPNPDISQHHWEVARSNPFTLSPIQGDGDYYVRACAWDGKEGCTLYSNVIQVFVN